MTFPFVRRLRELATSRGWLASAGVTSASLGSKTGIKTNPDSKPQPSESPPMAYQILVSSYTEDVTTLTFDPKLSSITVSSAVHAGHHPSWITKHPDDPSLVFTGLEQTEGVVLAIKYDKEWKGKVVGEVSSKGADPCDLLCTKDELLVANYSSGSITSIAVSSAPPYFLDKAPETVSFEGRGPNTDRQEGAHAHQVYLHPSTGELLVVDLGSDKVHRLAKNQSGSWAVEGNIVYEGGAGPRHVAVYGEYLFTALELSNGISKHKFNSLPTGADFISAASSLSVQLPSPDMLVSEILIPKPNQTYSEPYIYLSNRNDPSPEGDTIAIFDLDLNLVAEVRTGLNHLRGMVFGGTDDKWLVAGGARGGGVAIFERVDGGKGLQKIAHNPEIKEPTGFLWA
ncbi:hypothetical protein ONZ45_g7371 [Pleurotus djamor]|nr:hypothetical protein ONZ45_g7371 [Pleurotus djamor]